MIFSSTLGVHDCEFRLIFGRTKIVYDHEKDKENRNKHKFSLESAVWLLEKLLVPIGTSRPHIISDSFIEKGEVRHLHMCVDDSDTVVFMVTTMRDHETIRIISLRRAHDDERTVFKALTGYVKIDSKK